MTLLKSTSAEDQMWTVVILLSLLPLIRSLKSIMSCVCFGFVTNATLYRSQLMHSMRELTLVSITATTRAHEVLAQPRLVQVTPSLRRESRCSSYRWLSVAVVWRWGNERQQRTIVTHAFTTPIHLHCVTENWIGRTHFLRVGIEVFIIAPLSQCVSTDNIHRKEIMKKETE